MTNYPFSERTVTVTGYFYKIIFSTLVITRFEKIQKFFFEILSKISLGKCQLNTLGYGELMGSIKFLLTWHG